MRELKDRIQAEGVYVGEGIITLDAFLNHQVDPDLTRQVGLAFARRFQETGIGAVTKVVTAEVSGIPFALETALALETDLLYARKSRSKVMRGAYYTEPAHSRTHGTPVELMIAKRFLSASDRIVIIDDFLATGSTLNALCRLTTQSGAELKGIGCVVEKPGEGGRESLASWRVPIETLARVTFEGDTFRVS